MTIICKYENNYQMRQYFLYDFSTTEFGQPNAFVSTFYFYLRTMQTHEKTKRACKPTHRGQCKLDTTALRPKRATSGNSTFAIGGVSCSADSFVVKESSVLRMNICGKKLAHRKSAKRQTV
jgi:hypothetical protein